ncbi:hypothetical protein PFLCHA0_c36970 [Pseudomonas protegens CHA0]|uniref:Uncharacterized protein n=1 Tax=Pseudomonas protegens (strain DSM 19095 / LMG 27888 / CFBP 6595 / CHA0) TaxID=1124983 RepID=A0A2C9EP76_PSEPH|nr:hypothetical protein PFLCHA0_c36970 [Pseudomonas protegens CHA0]
MPFGKRRRANGTRTATPGARRFRHRITPPGCSENLGSRQVSWLRACQSSDRRLLRLPTGVVDAHAVALQQSNPSQLRGQPRHRPRSLLSFDPWPKNLESARLRRARGTVNRQCARSSRLAGERAIEPCTSAAHTCAAVTAIDAPAPPMISYTPCYGCPLQGETGNR